MPIRPDYVKDIAQELIDQYPQVVSTEFDRNKQIVEEATNIQSKTVRNRIAGYIARMQSPTETDQSASTAQTAADE